MLRSFITILLPATLFLLGPVPAPVNGQWERPMPARRAYPDISGHYVTGSGANCYVYCQRRGFLFVNERGSRAIFAWSGPRQLRVVRIVDGWDPNIVVTVTRDADGRRVLQFDAPDTPTGFWTRVP
jgi:hypothetical protein